MDSRNVDMFLMTHGKYFSNEKLPLIKSRLESMNEDSLILVSSCEFKDPKIIFIISLFFGSLGIDRFLIGDTGMGILKLLTFGMCCLFTVIDWFLITDRTKEKNFEEFMKMSSI